MTETSNKPAIPTWLDGLGMGWILTPFLMWLSSSELWASLIAFAWLAVRAYLGTHTERRCMGLALFFGLVFEVALWISGACLYTNPGILGTPLWILPLWCGGGLLLTRFTAPSEWEKPKDFMPALALVPFLVGCVLPGSWLSTPIVVSLALLTAAFLWRSGGEPPHWNRAIRVLLVGLGGMSASWGFGVAGVCIFPQAIYGIPPWALSLWTSLVVVLLAFRKRA